MAVDAREVVEGFCLKMIFIYEVFVSSLLFMAASCVCVFVSGCYIIAAAFLRSLRSQAGDAGGSLGYGPGVLGDIEPFVALTLPRIGQLRTNDGTCTHRPFRPWNRTLLVESLQKPYVSASHPLDGLLC